MSERARTLADDPERREQWDERFRSVDWTLLPNPPLKPQYQVAMDETLTLSTAASKRGPNIRFWNWAGPCVVLGRFQSVRNEVYEDVAAEQGVELVRRISGGGAMLIEPEGAITYSIAAPESLVEGMSFAESYQFFDSWVIDALRELGVDAWYVPLNDITSSGGKVGGAAQARRGGAVLHHTTMAYSMTPGKLVQILRVGKEKLSDKGITSADKRVGPLRDQTDLDRDVIIHHMIGHFRSRFGLTDGDFSDAEQADVQERVETRFSTRDWIYFLP
jgi:lipoate-protein ligase A